MKLRTSHYIIGIVLLAGAGLVFWGIKNASTPGKADALAQCLTEKGVTIYGAYWCPNCQNQKKAFGKSWKYIDYIECSLPGGRGQTLECNQAGIKGYPTWDFPGGKRVSGNTSLEKLANQAGCEYGDAVTEKDEVQDGESSPATSEATTTPEEEMLDDEEEVFEPVSE